MDGSSLCAVFVAILKLTYLNGYNFRPGALYQNAAGRELTVLVRLKQTDDSSSSTSSNSSSSNSSSSNSVTLLAATSFKADDPTGLGFKSVAPKQCCGSDLDRHQSGVDPHADPTLSFTDIGNSEFFYLHSQQCQRQRHRLTGVIIFNILDTILK